MARPDVTNQRIVDAGALATTDALLDAGIEFVVLKGPALARMLYPGPEVRAYADFDVLVAPGDREAAREVIRGLGFDNQPEWAGDADYLGVAHSEEWTTADGAIVDLHWRLYGTQVPAEQLWLALRDECAEIDLDGRRVRVLAPPASAMHLAIHAAQSGPLGPKSLGDLERGLELWPIAVWKSAAAIANALRATEVFAAGLRLLPEGEALARQLELPATPELDWMILNGALRPRGTFHMQRFVQARGWRAKAEVVRRALLPSAAWFARLDPRVEKRGLRLWVAYVSHVLLRAPSWAFRSWLFLRRARRAARSPRP